MMENICIDFYDKIVIIIKYLQFTHIYEKSYLL